MKLFLLLTGLFLEQAFGEDIQGYTFMEATCNSGGNYDLRHGQTAESCAEICSNDPGCKSFELYASHGGSNTINGHTMGPGDCYLQSGADHSGCNGAYWNVDLYVKDESNGAQAATTAPQTASAGAHGDPHLVTWSGEKYDFHGICDLVLLSNPEFNEDKGLDIHIRTKKIHEFSYIESSAIRIGNDIIEVTGGKNNMNKVRINGLIREIENTGDEEQSLDILGYDVRFKKMGDKAQQFVVDLGGFGESIIFKIWNSFVSIKVQNPSAKNFVSSVGLMGSFPSGEKIARDNKTVVNNVDVFGQEWQVNGEEAKLFHEAKGPQFPEKCEIPSSSDMRRRLADSDITMKKAEDICSDVKEYKEMCIFDVMVTNDLTMAGAY